MKKLFIFVLLCLLMHTNDRVKAEDNSGDKKAIPLQYDVDLTTIHSGYDGKKCWVHPKMGTIPGKTPSVVLTMQKLLLSGSDVFYALNEMRTDDLGKTWSSPKEHVTLGRRQESFGAISVICDFTPMWHAKTKTILGTGHIAHYKGDRQTAEFKRQAGYSVYDQKTRTWSPWATIKMPDEAKFFTSGAGCTQRVDLPNGDVLLPVYSNVKGKRQFIASVLRCRFDGKTLSYVEHGNGMTIDHFRGMSEPSLAHFKGRFYLTIRTDPAAYVASSDDGLHFNKPIKWTFDDGQELGSYNTQQHWVTHSEGLFLVYTRRGANNDHIFRHRGPLFMAQVDTEKLQVIRATERVLVPERGARLGNFDVTNVNENETWVSVAEWMQSISPNYIIPVDNKLGADNSIYVSKIKWNKPNKIVITSDD